MFTAATEEQLQPAIDATIEALNQNNIVLFRGDLGAGKTTMIKRICKQLGVVDAMSSPSFGIVNEYEAQGNPVYHVDLYRIKTPEEVYEFGLHEILDSEAPCFIEWPEMAEEIWQDYDVVTVRISADNQGLRRIFVS